MKKQYKKLISIFVAAAIMASFAIPAFAEKISADNRSYQQIVEELNAEYAQYGLAIEYNSQARTNSTMYTPEEFEDHMRQILEEEVAHNAMLAEKYEARTGTSLANAEWI